MSASETLFDTSILGNLQASAKVPQGHEALKAAGRLNYFHFIESPRLKSTANFHFYRSQGIVDKTIYANKMLSDIGDFITAGGVFKDVLDGDIVGAAGGVYKQEAKKLLGARLKELAEALPLPSASQDFVAAKMNDILNLIVFDVLGAVNPAAAMSNATSALAQEILSAGINIGALAAGIVEYGRYQRWEHIKFFLQDYYRCDSDLSCLRIKNSIPEDNFWADRDEKYKLFRTVNEFFVRRQQSQSPRPSVIFSATWDDYERIVASIETTDAFIVDRLRVYLENQKKPTTPDEPVKYTLKVDKIGRGLIKSSPSALLCGTTCSAYLDENTSVEITAAPSEGYRFVEWRGACSGTGPTCSVSMDAAHTVVAKFEELPKPVVRSLDVISAGQGSIASTSGINCGADCTEVFNLDTYVTLHAVPRSSLYRFTGWSDQACEGIGDCTVLVDGPKMVGGSFESCISLEHLWQKTGPLYAGELNNFDAQFAIHNNCATPVTVDQATIDLHRADDGVYYKTCYVQAGLIVPANGEFDTRIQYCTVTDAGDYHLYAKINVKEAGVDSWKSLAQQSVSFVSRPVTIPSVPEIDSAVVQGSSQITLSWSGLYYYRLYRATSVTGTYSEVFSNYSLSFTDHAVAPGTTYYYKLRRCSNSNFESCSDASNVASASTPTALSAATLLSAFTLSAAEVQQGEALSMDATLHNSGVSAVDDRFRFAFVLSEDGTLSADDTVRFDNAGASFGLPTGTSATFSHRLAISATQALGDYMAFACVNYTESATNQSSSYCGRKDFSVSAVSVVVPDVPYRPLITYRQGTTEVRVAWNSGSGGKYYRLYRGESPAGPFTDLYEGGQFAFIDTGVTIGKTYYYKLKSCQSTDAASCSAFSDASSVNVTGAATHDFTVSRLHFSRADSTLAIEATQRYSGTSQSYLGVFMGFYLSDDVNCSTTDDYYLGEVVPSLYINDLLDVERVDVTLPSMANSGTWYVCAIADHRNEFLETSEHNNARVLTVATDVPAPKLIPKVYLSLGQIDASWNDVPGNVSYRLLRSSSPDMSDFNYIYIGTDTSFRDQRMGECVEVYYQLQSCNGTSADALCSSSPVVMGTSLRYKSVPPEVTVLTDQTVQIDWGAQTCAKYAYVHREGNGDSRYIYMGTATSYIDKALYGGNAYSYRVGHCVSPEGFFDNGCSYSSDPISVSLPVDRPSNADWVEHPSVPGIDGRTGEGQVVFRNRLWVIGGRHGDVNKSDILSSLDGVNWVQEVENAPFGARAYMNTVVFNGRMYLIGGRDAAETQQKDVWSSADGVTWMKEASNTPFPERSGATLTALNGRMWLIGGMDRSSAASGELGDVWSSADGRSWHLETASAAFGARRYHQAFVAENRLWVVGGLGGPAEIAYGAYGDIWSSADGLNWRLDTDKASFGPRYKHAIIEFNGRYWLSGGFARFVGEYDPDHGTETWRKIWTGRQESDLWVSDDGLNWSLVTYATPMSGVALPAIVFDNRMWVGNLGSVVWSADNCNEGRRRAFRRRCDDAGPRDYYPRCGC